MILDEEKVLKQIADFLSGYIKSTTLKDFWIKPSYTICDKLVFNICLKARETCGSNIYVPWNVIGSENPYVFVHPEDPKHDCLIVSTLCRTNGIIDRDFHKHHDYADIYPILDLYKSDVIQLTKSFEEHYSLDKEYIDKENKKNGIISMDSAPNKHPDWYRYTKPQKKMIAEMHAREKATRHKCLISRGAIYLDFESNIYVR